MFGSRPGISLLEGLYSWRKVSVNAIKKPKRAALRPLFKPLISRTMTLLASSAAGSEESFSTSSFAALRRTSRDSSARLL